MKLIQATCAIASMLALAGCGTVSPMTAADSSAEAVLPLYDTAVVLDFNDATSVSMRDQEKLAAHHERVAVAGPHFADLVAAELRNSKLYETVLREPYDGPALQISGDITRYAQGNAAARLFVGLGAGSSYFDCTIVFSDNLTGERLARMVVDKNSWALGGALAAGQTVEGYMQGAAKRVAEEIMEARQSDEAFETDKELRAGG